MDVYINPINKLFSKVLVLLCLPSPILPTNNLPISTSSPFRNSMTSPLIDPYLSHLPYSISRFIKATFSSLFSLDFTTPSQHPIKNSFYLFFDLLHYSEFWYYLNLLYCLEKDISCLYHPNPLYCPEKNIPRPCFILTLDNWLI